RDRRPWPARTRRTPPRCRRIWTLPPNLARRPAAPGPGAPPPWYTFAGRRCSRSRARRTGRRSSVGANQVDGDSSGVQLTVGYNQVGGDMRHVQSAVYANDVGANVDGVQLAVG